MLVLAMAAPLTAVLGGPQDAGAGTAKPGSTEVIVTGEAPVKPEIADKITDPKHPDFVRCRSEPMLNSRAARVKVCRTNKEWAAAGRDGNRRTQELLNSGRPLQPTP